MMANKAVPPWLRSTALVVVGSAVTLALFSPVPPFRGMLLSGGFMPHGHCYLESVTRSADTAPSTAA